MRNTRHHRSLNTRLQAQRTVYHMQTKDSKKQNDTEVYQTSVEVELAEQKQNPKNTQVTM